MKYQRTLAIAAVVAAWLMPALLANADGKGHASPAQFVADWAASFNKNDTELLLAFYEESKETLLIMSAGIRCHGYEAIKRAYHSDANKVRFYDSKPNIISTRTLGDTAVITLEHKFKTEFVDNKSHWQVHVQTTMVLNRRNGQWKIAMEHSSPIKGVDRYTQIETEAL